jgi:hypothetical protein
VFPCSDEVTIATQYSSNLAEETKNQTRLSSPCFNSISITKKSSQHCIFLSFHLLSSATRPSQRQMRDLAQRAAVMRSEANLARDLRGGGGGAAGANLSLFSGHVWVRWRHNMGTHNCAMNQNNHAFWPKTQKHSLVEYHIRLHCVFEE